MVDISVLHLSPPKRNTDDNYIWGSKEELELLCDMNEHGKLITCIIHYAYLLSLFSCVGDYSQTILVAPSAVQHF